MFLAGPPLVKMATGEESDDESLGGAEMHCRGLGPGRLLRRRRARRASGSAARSSRQLNWRKPGPGPSLPRRRAGLRPRGAARHRRRATCASPFDLREVIARIVDGSRFEEFKPLYGTTLVTGWASIHGYPVGILANNGVLFSGVVQKAAQFIQLCNQIDVPLLFLQNITGYMVGKRVRAGRHHQERLAR